jgi:hypothetical protein
MFERVPELDDMHKRIYREMDPLFLQFYATAKAVAVGGGKPVMYIYGDPDEIDRSVAVYFMPSAAVGFTVHPECNREAAMQYLHSLIGDTYFDMVKDSVNSTATMHEEITPDNVEEVLDRFKQMVMQHLQGKCGCDDDEKKESQTELPLWVSNIMQEEKTDA